MTNKTKLGTFILTFLMLGFTVPQVQAQVISVTGVGPVNRAMGGAGTAAPLDSIGALHWNPGSISGLAQSELSFGVELINVPIEMTTNVGGVSNSNNSDGGFSPIPTIGWVHHVEDTPLTIGLGVMGVAGFKNNMPVNPSSPIPTFAAGPAYADAEVLQLVPTLSYALSDRLSVGVAPTISLAKLTLDPIGPSIFTPGFTPGTGNRIHWGGGFQVGAYFIANEAWHFGASFKSRQYFETFHFHAPGGTFLLDFDYPMIVSLGTAFTGMEDWTIAADFRYFDYGNTDPFNRLGFSNQFAFAIGAQYRMSDRLHVRAGYNVNGDSIHDNDAAANIITPLIQKHNIAFGGSWKFACNVDLNAAYVYLVENDLTGPLPPPFAPTDTVTNEIEGHSAIMGVTVRY